MENAKFNPYYDIKKITIKLEKGDGDILEIEDSIIEIVKREILPTPINIYTVNRMNKDRLINLNADFPEFNERYKKILMVALK